MTFREKITAEREKISAMDNKKKFEYFKSYYMWPSLAILAGLILLVLFLKDVLIQKNPVSMGCAFGVELTPEQEYALSGGYLEHFGLNPKKCDAVVATDFMFAGTAQQMDAYANEMALQAQIAAGEIYYLMFDEETMERMAAGGIYSTLEEVLPKETIDRLSDAVVSITDPETGETYKGAIDLKKLGFLTEEWQSGYLIFTIAQPDAEYPQRFLEYLETCGREN